MDKKIKQKKDPKSREVQQIEQPDAYYSKTPRWAFGSCDKRKWSFTVDGAGTAFWDEILPHFQAWENMTWQEILVSHKQSNHSINVKDLNKEARDRLIDLKIGTDSIISLRLSGKHRLYGIITDATFCIIWYDTDHGDNPDCVCRSHLKYTQEDLPYQGGLFYYRQGDEGMSTWNNKYESELNKVLKKINEAVSKSVDDTVDDARFEIESITEKYIEAYYKYTPRKYRRRDNLWHILKTRYDNGFFEISFDPAYFPRPYKKGTDPEMVWDLVFEGSRAPFWFAIEDPANFGQHVVTYPGDDYNAEIFETVPGALFSDLFDIWNKNIEENIAESIVKRVYKEMEGLK